MLGYISSTRKKSCYACVKAKRRCDLGYPFCKRCFVKGLDCKYPNAQQVVGRPAEVVLHPEVIIRQSTPDFSPPQASVASSSAEPLGLQIDPTFDVNIDPLFLQDSASSSDSSGPCYGNGNGASARGWRQESPAHLAPRIGRTLLPEVSAPSMLQETQVLAIVRGLRALVSDTAFSGSNDFLHQRLYQKHQPQAYQDCVAISALYMTNNPRNETILANIINAKISGLITDSSTWTLVQHLAAVQALIIYQIIRLFDPNPNLQAQGVKHVSLLEIWAAHLWKRFFNEKPRFQNSHERWVFNESLRRTTLISVFSRCGWSIFARGGLSDQVPLLSRLPYTRDPEAWTCDADGWSSKGQVYETGEERLISYGDMTATWTYDQTVERLDGFSRLLLTACRGRDDPRLLV